MCTTRRDGASISNPLGPFELDDAAMDCGKSTVAHREGGFSKEEGWPVSTSTASGADRPQ
jgi:hypothetical protein